MSYFRVALQRESERRRLSQTDLARVAGLSRSYISRLMSGESAELSDENLVAILKVFSADARAQAELVAARCMDARVGPGSELVEIGIKTKSPNPNLSPHPNPLPVGLGEGTRSATAKETVPPDVRLSEETERAFAWLRSQCPVNADLEKHLVGYAKLTGMKDKSESVNQ